MRGAGESYSDAILRLAKTARKRLRLDACAAGNLGRGLRRRVVPHVAHVVG
jgi:hypothetical protein